MSRHRPPALLAVLVIALHVTVACGGGSPVAPASTAAPPSPSVQSSCSIAIAADDVSHELSAAAATFTVPVGAAAGCSWTAVATAAFLSISAGASGSGPGTVEITLAENTGDERRGTVQIGSATLSVTQGAATPAVTPPPAEPPPGPPTTPAPAPPSGPAPPTPAPPPAPTPPPPPGPVACAYEVTPTSAGVTADGGTVLMTVDVTQGVDCRWTIETADTFVTIDGATARTGSDSVRVTVARNTGSFRTGSLTIAGQAVRVTQEGAGPGVPIPVPGPTCSVTVSPLSIAVPAEGAEVSVDVRTQGTSCTWSALPQSPGVTMLSPVERVGDGSVVFRIAANTGPARTGTATVAGRTVSFVQPAVAPATCVYSVSPTRTSLPVSGGTVTFDVRVTQGVDCTWSTVIAGSGMTILSGSQSVGNGSVVVSVAANPGTERWNGLVIAGTLVTIHQPAAPGGCVYTVTPHTFSITAAAQNITFDVTLTTGSRDYCQFSIATDGHHLQVGPATIIGNITRYLVAVSENTSFTARTLHATAAQIQVKVTQAGRTPVP